MSIAEGQLGASGVTEQTEWAASEGILIASPAFAQRWGWFPALTLVNALGLLTITFANQAATTAGARAELFFWLGLLLMIVPSAMRLIALEPTRRERMSIVTSLGIALYLVKVVHSPFAFTYGDEFFHLFNTNQIVNAQALFAANPVLPVSPMFPGLAAVTAALATLSGLSIFQAGLILIGVARLLLCLAFFLFAESVSRSARVAGLATLFYMSHSNFLFWSAQFAYESLALPLAVAVLYLITRREEQRSAVHYASLSFLALLGISAIVVTHHLTSYFMVIMLVLWWLMVRTGAHHFFANLLSAFSLQSNSKLSEEKVANGEATGADEVALRTEHGPQGLAPYALIAAVAWLVFVAILTVNYLSPLFNKGMVSFLEMIIGDGDGRQLFVSATGYTAPLWERVVGIGSVALSLLLLPFGLWQLWQRARHHAIALLLGVAAIGYFAVLGMRLTTAGWELSNRSSAYLFIGLAYLLALAVTYLWPDHRPVGPLRGVLFGLLFSVLFAGGVIAGWPPQLRVSQPYLVDADGATVPAPGRQVADWMKTTLGAGHTVAADEANGRYLLAYGEQQTYVGRFPMVRDIITAPQLEPRQIGAMALLELDYLLVDRRQRAWDNMAGYFFADGAAKGAAWFAPAVQTKYDNQPAVNRVLDAGDIVLYDVQPLLANPRVAAARAAALTK